MLPLVKPLVNFVISIRIILDTLWKYLNKQYFNSVHKKMQIQLLYFK